MPESTIEERQTARPGLGAQGALPILASFGSFVLSYLLVTILHECGHFLAVHFFSRPCALFTNHVEYDYTLLSTGQNIAVAVGGLMVSFIIWVASFFLRKLVGKVNPTVSLLLFWLCLWSIVSFWGYVFTAAFPVYGDLSYICMALQLPVWLRVVVSMAGMAVFYFAAAALLPQAKKMMGYGNLSANALFLYPVLLGTLFILLFSLPATNFFLLVYPAFSVFYIFPFYFDAKKGDLPFKHAPAYRVFLSLLFLLFSVALFIGLKNGVRW